MLTQDSMTLDQVGKKQNCYVTVDNYFQLQSKVRMLFFMVRFSETILQETDHNGFPVVISKESQCLVGFVLRRDLHLAISNAKATQEGVTGSSLVLFKDDLETPYVGHEPVKLCKIIDLVS